MMMFYDMKCVESVKNNHTLHSNNYTLKLLYTLITTLYSLGLYSQEVKGYVSDMPSVIWQNVPQSTWYWQNLTHNRLDFSWQFAKYFSLDASMRNRFIFGSETMIDAGEMNFDKGYADLTWNCFADKTAILNTTFDRFFLTFEREKWKLQLGRQRINWGQTFVWNPNDIFNTYSFFDFDYPERPGCDAVRATYFHNETASTELAASVNHNGKTTAALMHHWNWKNFDFQVIGGIFEQSDVVLGGAWTGDFSGLNLRGEFSFFQPFENNSNWKLSEPVTLSASIGLDYLFSNSLMLQAEALYNNVEKSSADGGLMSMYSAPLSAKMLSICEWNIFAQASYPITPRLNGSLSGMYFVGLDAFYAGVSLDYSLFENVDLSLISQYFTTDNSSVSGGIKACLGFARIKWSF
jgi:hypothetical protein